MLLSPAVVGASNALPASGASLPISSYSSIIPIPYTNTLLKMTSKHSENNRIIGSKVRYSIKNQKSDRCRLGDLNAYLTIDELKTAPQQGKAVELSFHCFPWLIKKESTNYNWEEDLNVRA